MNESKYSAIQVDKYKHPKSRTCFTKSDKQIKPYSEKIECGFLYGEIYCRFLFIRLSNASIVSENEIPLT